MADITIERQGEDFEVRVSERGSETVHRVRVDRPDLAAGYETPEDFLGACFRFLLAREPKEAILPSFDVSVISRYFPEFDEAIRR